MDFSVKKKEGYSILTVNVNRIDAKAIAQFNSELVLLSGQQEKRVIIDLSSCDYCDSAGLSCITIAHRLFLGKLILVGVQGSVERILSVQNFNPQLVTTATIEEAEQKIITL